MNARRKPIPDAWADKMMRHGFTHRGLPSMSKLAMAAGVSTETVRRFIFNVGVADAATIVAVSTAMGEDMSDWAGVSRLMAERAQCTVPTPS